jgi:hypothetical protein
MRTYEWLTPPEILDALGPFDLDPCAPRVRPWPMASRHYSIEDNGLAKEWVGRVWCNPPYGREVGQWLARCKAHGDAIALIFARTETDGFFKHVWGGADAILFLRGRLNFYDVNGRRSPYNSGAPSCLVAYGEGNREALSVAVQAALPGRLVDL